MLLLVVLGPLPVPHAAVFKSLVLVAVQVAQVAVAALQLLA
jgi:hypothetical protein